MHCGPQDARGPQFTAGLRGCDKRGACYPGLRGWDNRSPRPVYVCLPFCRGATEAFGRRHGLPTHWSGGLCHPGLQEGEREEVELMMMMMMMMMLEMQRSGVGGKEQ